MMTTETVVAESDALKMTRSQDGSLHLFARDDSTALADLPPLKSEDDAQALMAVLQRVHQCGASRANKRIAEIADAALLY